MRHPYKPTLSLLGPQWNLFISAPYLIGRNRWTLVGGTPSFVGATGTSLTVVTPDGTGVCAALTSDTVSGILTQLNSDLGGASVTALEQDGYIVLQYTGSPAADAYIKVTGGNTVLGFNVAETAWAQAGDSYGLSSPIAAIQDHSPTTKLFSPTESLTNHTVNRAILSVQDNVEYLRKAHLFWDVEDVYIELVDEGGGVYSITPAFGTALGAYLGLLVVPSPTTIPVYRDISGQLVRAINSTGAAVTVDDLFCNGNISFEWGVEDAYRFENGPGVYSWNVTAVEDEVVLVVSDALPSDFVEGHIYVALAGSFTSNLPTVWAKKLDDYRLLVEPASNRRFRWSEYIAEGVVVAFPMYLEQTGAGPEDTIGLWESATVSLTGWETEWLGSPYVHMKVLVPKSLMDAPEMSEVASAFLEQSCLAQLMTDRAASVIPLAGEQFLTEKAIALLRGTKWSDYDIEHTAFDDASNNYNLEEQVLRTSLFEAYYGPEYPTFRDSSSTTPATSMPFILRLKEAIRVISRSQRTIPVVDVTYTFAGGDYTYTDIGTSFFEVEFAADTLDPSYVGRVIKAEVVAATTYEWYIVLAVLSPTKMLIARYSDLKIDPAVDFVSLAVYDGQWTVPTSVQLLHEAIAGAGSYSYGPVVDMPIQYDSDFSEGNWLPVIQNVSRIKVDEVEYTLVSGNMCEFDSAYNDLLFAATSDSRTVPYPHALTVLDFGAYNRGLAYIDAITEIGGLGVTLRTALKSLERPGEDYDIPAAEDGATDTVKVYYVTDTSISPEGIVDGVAKKVSAVRSIFINTLNEKARAALLGSGEDEAGKALVLNALASNTALDTVALLASLYGGDPEASAVLFNHYRQDGLLGAVNVLKLFGGTYGATTYDPPAPYNRAPLISSAEPSAAYDTPATVIEYPYTEYMPTGAFRGEVFAETLDAQWLNGDPLGKNGVVPDPRYGSLGYPWRYLTGVNTSGLSGSSEVVSDGVFYVTSNRIYLRRGGPVVPPSAGDFVLIPVGSSYVVRRIASVSGDYYVLDGTSGLEIVVDTICLVSGATSVDVTTAIAGTEQYFRGQAFFGADGVPNYFVGIVIGRTDTDWTIRMYGPGGTTATMYTAANAAIHTLVGGHALFGKTETENQEVTQGYVEEQTADVVAGGVVGSTRAVSRDPLLACAISNIGLLTADPLPYGAGVPIPLTGSSPLSILEALLLERDAPSDGVSWQNVSGSLDTPLNPHSYDVSAHAAFYALFLSVTPTSGDPILYIEVENVVAPNTVTYVEYGVPEDGYIYIGLTDLAGTAFLANFGTLTIRAYNYAGDALEGTFDSYLFKGSPTDLVHVALYSKGLVSTKRISLVCSDNFTSFLDTEVDKDAVGVVVSEEGINLPGGRFLVVSDPGGGSFVGPAISSTTPLGSSGVLLQCDTADNAVGILHLWFPKVVPLPALSSAARVIHTFRQAAIVQGGAVVARYNLPQLWTSPTRIFYLELSAVLDEFSWYYSTRPAFVPPYIEVGSTSNVYCKSRLGNNILDAPWVTSAVLTAGTVPNLCLYYDEVTSPLLLGTFGSSSAYMLAVLSNGSSMALSSDGATWTYGSEYPFPDVGAHPNPRYGSW